ncbi:MAG: hypothetical protein R3F59_19195 [Myxococcota bacterium]
MERFLAVVRDAALPAWARVRAADIAITSMLARGRSGEAAAVPTLQGLVAEAPEAEAAALWPSVHLCRGRLAEAAGRTDDAVAAYELADAALLADGARFRAAMARQHTGQALLFGQRTTEAVRKLTAAVAALEEDPLPAQRMSRGYVSGLLGEALLRVDLDRAQEALRAGGARAAGAHRAGLAHGGPGPTRLAPPGAR